MQITLRKIAEAVGGVLQGDGELSVENIANLDEATEKDLSIFFELKLREELLNAKSRAVVMTEELNENPEIKKCFSKPVIVIKNPRMAMVKLLEIFYPEKSDHPALGVHPTVIRDAGVKLGAEVSIGPYTVIGKNSEIGSDSIIYAHCYIGSRVSIGMNCLIYPNVTIREGAQIGNNVIIHSGAVIGSDGFGFIDVKNDHAKIPQIGIVRIEDNVEIGANAAIDRGTIGKTVIGAGTKLDNLVHIAHNVKIGRNCFILGLVGIAGSAKIGDNVKMAGQSAVTDHAVVGDDVVITGKAGVTGNIKPGEVVSGFPARPHREFLKTQALLGRLPELVKKLRKKDT